MNSVSFQNQVFIVVLRSMGVKKKKDIWAAWAYNASMAQCDHSTGTEDTAACMHVCVAYIREGKTCGELAQDLRCIWYPNE